MRKCPSPTGFFKVDNLLGELWTEAQKSIARKNLGIADENSLFWGNIKGQIENQKDVKSFINSSVKKETQTQFAEQFETTEKVLALLKLLSEWAGEEDGIRALTQTVSQNTININKLQNKSVYLTQDKYDELIRNGLIDYDVEYNIYEEDETL